MLHNIAARQAARASRGGLQAGARAAPASRRAAGQTLLARRAASSNAPSKGEVSKSDVPYAIGSAVVFGSLLVYLTGPGKGGGGHGAHGHDDKHGKDEGKELEKEDEEGDDPESEASASDDGGDEPKEESDGPDAGGEDDAPSTPETSEDEDDEYVNVKKIEDKPGEGAPAGARALAERSLSAEEGAHLQKPTRKPGQGEPQRRDDSTFQHGIAASKEGNKDPSNRDAVISNPKKVVAAAHTERQAKQARAKGESDGGEGDEKAKQEQEE